MRDDFSWIYKYENLRLYNLIEVVENFSCYYGFSLEEMEVFLRGIVVLDWEDIISKIDSCDINNKINTYFVYKKSLENLTAKGLELVSIIKYLCDDNNILEDYEKRLDDMDIYHYGSVLTGNSINKILIVLYHLIKSVNGLNDIVNLVDTYVECGYGFFDSCEDECISPNRCLVVYDDEWNKNLLDKTSFVVKRKVRSKIEN